MIVERVIPESAQRLMREHLENLVHTALDRTDDPRWNYILNTIADWRAGERELSPEGVMLLANLH